MKKYIISGLSVALALFAATSCNQDLLDIPQKGVVAYEDFYHTDEDAESALVAVYQSAISLISGAGNGINNPSWNVLINAPGDELYWGGGKKNGSSEGGQEMNEFRHTYDNNIPHLSVCYKRLYSLIYKCNLVIDNFYGEEGEKCDSQIKKRCVAEARVLRAWAHFNLACYWGTPPLVDHVLAGDARPTNCDHQVLMDWIIAEYKAALPDLEERKGQSDISGAYKITKGACQAFLGKAQVFNKDWEDAKESLKAVINSNNYDLVDGDKIPELFHAVGDGNKEKVFELNYDYNEGIGAWDGQYHFQRNLALFFRMFHTYPDFLIKTEGWGNNCAPTKKFADAIMANEPNSARRKAYIATYEEMLVDYEYSSLDYKADGTPLTKEEKLMDPKRGMNYYKYDELYANYGYFFLKFMPWEEDLIPNDPSITDENRTIMRYSEVLLLYAEACAMSTDDGSGLAALNKVAQRAGAPTYAELNMENVKKEKWFELAWEGTRFLDLVRWGDAEKELAFKAKDEVPYLFDEFYVHGTKGKEVSGKPHEARIIFKDDGWDELGGGYVAGKHELYPFPFDVIELNRWDEATGTGLKQNPGWE